MTGAKSSLLVLPVVAVCMFVLAGLASAGDSESGKKTHRKTGITVKPKGYKPQTTTASSQKGKQLFEKNKCTTCHTVSQAGGCLAPPLNGVGARRTRQFIESRFTEGMEDRFATIYGDVQLMPHVRVPAGEAKLITEYLRTLPEPKGGFKIIGHGNGDSSAPVPKSSSPSETASNESIKRGAGLVNDKGCLACHSLGGFGGEFGPKFDGIGARKSKEAMKKQMKNAEFLIIDNGSEYGGRGTTMPPLNLSDRNMEDLANYLSTLM